MTSPLGANDERVALAVTALTRDVNDLAGRTRSWRGEADVFIWFLEQLADLCLRHASALDVLRSAAPEFKAPLGRTIVEAGGRALRDAQDAGLVRADLEARDILTIASLFGAGLSDDLAERRAVSLRIILNGLKARP